MIIKMLVGYACEGFSAAPGQCIDVSQEEAKRYLDSGQAEKPSEQEIEEQKGKLLEDKERQSALNKRLVAEKKEQDKEAEKRAKAGAKAAKDSAKTVGKTNSKAQAEANAKAEAEAEADAEAEAQAEEAAAKAASAEKNKAKK